MPNSDDRSGWVVTPEDDAFHQPSDHPWETETFWASFNIPERKMSGWFYNQVLANRGDTGLCNGGAFVWNDEDEPPYANTVHAVPIGLPRDLNDILLPNGNHILTIDHLKRYRVRRNDPGRFECDLYFDAVMEPNPHPAGVWPFIKGRHFDQAMHVTGELKLNGEQIAIDCLSVRDRSWSPRPPSLLSTEKEKAQATGAEIKPRRPRRGVGYFFGTASAQDAFLAYTSWTEEGGVDTVDTGYLVRDAVWAHIVQGERRCVVDPDREWIWRIEFEGVDTLGRSINAVGVMASHQGAKGPGNALYHWTWNGAEGWGENQGGSAAFYPRRRRESALAG
ncbi:MAG: DUF7065 domain-containing protein [Caulobacteraceae bacterium]